jgi:hypothetical protein
MLTVCKPPPKTVFKAIYGKKTLIRVSKGTFLDIYRYKIGKLYYYG